LDEAPNKSIFVLFNPDAKRDDELYVSVLPNPSSVNIVFADIKVA